MSTFRNIIARRRPMSKPDEPSEQSALFSLDDIAATDKPEPQFGPGASDGTLEPPDEIRPPSHVTSRPLSAPPPLPDLPRLEMEPPRPTMGDEMLYPAPQAEEEPQEPELEPEIANPSARRKIWDLDFDDDAEDEDVAESAPAAPSVAPQVPEIAPDVPEIAPDVPQMAPDVSQMAPKIEAPMPVVPTTKLGGRVKTRLLGFHSDDDMRDAFSAKKAVPTAQSIKCPVGWVVVVDGPGYGSSFALAAGLSTVGRGADQTVSLDFGDDSISRDNHASIAYDEEENQVLIGHGGKSNLVRLNGKALVSTEELRNGDQIRIGKTTLRFVALCGPDFSWSEQDAEAGADD